jgi:hypothetical protein
MYDTPNFLNEVVNNTLGKIVSISVIMFLLYQFGNTTGILAALIYILVLHRTQEGFEISISARREGMREGHEDHGDEEEDEEEEEDDEEDEDVEEGFKEGKDSKKSTKGKKKKKKNKKKKKEEEEGEEEEGEEKDGEEGFKNFVNSRNLKYNNLNDVHSVKPGINYRNRTDLDREMKVNAEKNKRDATKE